MINELKYLTMTLKQGIKTALYTVVSIVFLVGMAVFIYTSIHSEKAGRFNAQDMKEFYDQGYKDGAENMRQACIREYTDTTVVTCHEGLR